MIIDIPNDLKPFIEKEIVTGRYSSDKRKGKLELGDCSFETLCQAIGWMGEIKPALFFFEAIANSPKDYGEQYAFLAKHR